MLVSHLDEPVPQCQFHMTQISVHSRAPATTTLTPIRTTRYHESKSTLASCTLSEGTREHGGNEKENFQLWQSIITVCSFCGIFGMTGRLNSLAVFGEREKERTGCCNAFDLSQMTNLLANSKFMISITSQQYQNASPLTSMTIVH